MKRFDGRAYVEDHATGVKKRFRITKLPQYLIVHVKRFFKNEFFMEKNPTIVNFPIKNFDLTDFVWDKKDSQVATVSVQGESNEKEIKKYKYDLLANIIHEGKVDSGAYRV